MHLRLVVRLPCISGITPISLAGCMVVHLCLLLGWSMLGRPVLAQQQELYQPFEYTMTADQLYAHPHRDVQVVAHFEGPKGRTF